MNTEDYVSFETAKLLKEKGFDEKCCMCWDEVTKTMEIADEGAANSELLTTYISAPTLQMAMKWLRKVHKIIPIILTGDYIQKPLYYWFRIDTVIEGRLKYAVYREDEKEFSSYEEACEAAIKYCLENLI